MKAALAAGAFGSYPFNISEIDRAFNRGASQQDEGELKEAYLDIEMFDSRLWLRVGKQSIVWGKTELFRTTDQFNPQDLALATLPSLEESAGSAKGSGEATMLPGNTPPPPPSAWDTNRSFVSSTLRHPSKAPL